MSRPEIGAQANLIFAPETSLAEVSLPQSVEDLDCQQAGTAWVTSLGPNPSYQLCSPDTFHDHRYDQL